jgi:hypothetical protein
MYTRKNTYELVLNPHPHEKQVFFIEFFLGYGGAPAITAWVETQQYGEWKDNGDYIEPRVSVSQKVYRYGRDILDKKRQTNADINGYLMADALAREAVVGREASSLVNSVVHDWIIKAPKSVSKPIREAAPEWWDLLTRRD